jgi:hypothetical protein
MDKNQGQNKNRTNLKQPEDVISQPSERTNKVGGGLEVFQRGGIPNPMVNQG